jgi:hypothetical protein
VRLPISYLGALEFRLVTQCDCSYRVICHPFATNSELALMVEGLYHSSATILAPGVAQAVYRTFRA